VVVMEGGKDKREEIDEHGSHMGAGFKYQGHSQLRRSPM